jgi:Ca-activated chloride channel homolog
MIRKAVLFITIMMILVSCSSKEESQENKEIVNNNEAVEEELKDEEKSEDDIENNEAETVQSDAIKDLPDTPAIPTTFAEAVEYPMVGVFSGDVTYNDDFSNYPELAEKLRGIPPITIDHPDDDIERVKRYIYSLFMENVTMPDTSLNQWSSMQLDNPESSEEGIKLKENYNIAILLDSSGSMGFMEGNQTRMALAKQAINDFVSGLPEQAKISLQVYGHVGTGSESDKEKSCENVAEVYPLSAYQQEEFKQALDQFEPAGWTPMAAAIERVEADFSKLDGKQNTNIIYIVSDGIETCDGDPVRAIKTLNHSNIDPVINIIGYQVDNDGLKQLKEMAKVSQGRYIHASSYEDLEAEFQKTTDMSELWSEWQSDSKNIIRQLHSKIKGQLFDWFNSDKSKTYRQSNNLKYALKFLHEEGIIDRDIYLDFSDEYRDSYLEISDQRRDIYDELYDINQETYEEKFSEVEERFESVSSN